jgi:predicted transcriptional regulator
LGRHAAWADYRVEGPRQERGLPLGGTASHPTVARGLSLNQVARAAGFSRNDIRRWEDGQHVPSVLNFQAVINALGYQLRLVKRDEAADDATVSAKG